MSNAEIIEGFNRVTGRAESARSSSREIELQLGVGKKNEEEEEEERTAAAAPVTRSRCVSRHRKLIEVHPR